jgi:hypothetical protein
MQQRRQQRLAVESLVLPFLATREMDKQVFQYLILNLSPEGAGIAIPSWAMARERLNQGERIGLHLPFRLHHKILDQGEVRWTTWREDLDAQTCGVFLDREVPAYYPVTLSLERGEVSVDLRRFRGPEELILDIVKDLYLLKRGVVIYLHHLAPYFSRVARVSRQDFAALRDILFEQAREKESNNRAALFGLWESLKGEGAAAGLAGLDLEALRGMVESAIYMELFQQALASPMAGQYLNAIKTLEGRLYYNYNTIVMLYLKSLSGA